MMRIINLILDIREWETVKSNPPLILDPYAQVPGYHSYLLGISIGLDLN